jgi:hypothetical protein
VIMEESLSPFFLDMEKSRNQRFKNLPKKSPMPIFYRLFS